MSAGIKKLEDGAHGYTPRENEYYRTDSLPLHGRDNPCYGTNGSRHSIVHDNPMYGGSETMKSRGSHYAETSLYNGGHPRGMDPRGEYAPHGTPHHGHPSLPRQDTMSYDPREPRYVARDGANGQQYGQTHQGVRLPRYDVPAPAMGAYDVPLPPPASTYPYPETDYPNHETCTNRL